MSFLKFWRSGRRRRNFGGEGGGKLWRGRRRGYIALDQRIELLGLAAENSKEKYLGENDSCIFIVGMQT